MTREGEIGMFASFSRRNRPERHRLRKIDTITRFQRGVPRDDSGNRRISCIGRSQIIHSIMGGCGSAQEMGHGATRQRVANDMFEIGAALLLAGESGQHIDLREAATNLKPLADLGHAGGQYGYGFCLTNG
jgi:hypothetical protein